MTLVHDYHKYAGTCKEACETLLLTRPELRLVRGHYHCPMWGAREHWWLQDGEGAIVDPTVEQFPTLGAGAEYVEFDGNCSCEQCGTSVKEEKAVFHGSYAFCSDACILRCVGL